MRRRPMLAATPLARRFLCLWTAGDGVVHCLQWWMLCQRRDSDCTWAWPVTTVMTASDLHQCCTSAVQLLQDDTAPTCDSNTNARFFSHG